LPAAPAEDAEPNFSTEYTTDEEVVDCLRMLGTQGARLIVVVRFYVSTRMEL
jgi:hypothetical protein